ITSFQPWGLADGTSGWDQNDPHGLYASGTAATASVVNPDVGGASFYVAGDLSQYATGGYSIRNTRTGLGSLIRGAVYNSTANRTLLTCNYNIGWRSEEHTSELQSPYDIVCRLLLEKKKPI